jgi:hypothetical protein
MNMSETRAFVDALMGLSLEDADNQEAIDEVREMHAHKRIMTLIHEGKGASLPGVKGTLWGTLNAATEFVDHFRKAASPEQRFFNAQWGTGEDLKEKAREQALALI